MIIKFKSLKQLVILVLLGAIITTTIILVSQISQTIAYFHPLKTKGNFTQQYLEKTSNLDDLGVADINLDSQLDIFTTNHGDRQSLLVKEGQNFVDKLSDLRLDQSPDFPGLEPSLYLPQIKQSGLYIYWKDSNTLVLNSYQLAEEKLITGKIRFPKTGKIIANQNFIFTLDENEQSPWKGQKPKNQYLKTYDFQSPQNGQVEIEYPGTPTLYLSLNKNSPQDQVYIGVNQINPASNYSILKLKDRHGMAWADYNSDGFQDVFIVRGGWAGKLKKIAPSTQEELLTNNGSFFSDQISNANLIKDGCPGRQVAWVDFNNDSLLDIYVVCGRGQEPGKLAPNQLFQQQKDGTFINVASQRRVDITGVGIFAWIDINKDNDQDLLWANREGLWLYSNESGNFFSQLISQSGNISKLAIADYDNDGDFDIFAASKSGNLFINNTSGKYEAIKVKSIGLPQKSNIANWVDYDNDGLMDLHLLPNGLYHQLPNHHFEALNVLKSTTKLRSIYLGVTWLDANNDGWRDLLVALDEKPTRLIRWWRTITKTNFQPKMNVWDILLYSHEPQDNQDNHWLQVELEGKKGNRPAIGAKVMVKTLDKTQKQQVGQFEGSRLSQGHYRLYFGLGKSDKADSIKVIWPDGKVKTLTNVQGDQILRLQY